ncbi:large subunit ribosomal protein L18 [Thermonema lapsum]|jgi:large subunit ribosomal protein L18|uniref:Large ribosomal subunit protein uL18 n=1 Tax=Thermonema lapsum TaxID=28195 RepID=A0A846MTF0_9BACT|nr:50S ribosomal protein L18 [Thermonema lapsum]NIK74580.1 large subunit ribosomal protein L18 [Thermonema lapsum]
MATKEQLKKIERRARIKKGLRKRIRGTAERPRLCVFRSNRRIYAQIINDELGVTLAAASSYDLKTDSLNVEVAKQVGKLIAERAVANGIKKVVFDRNGYLYHGRVKALAEGAREGGLEF